MTESSSSNYAEQRPDDVEQHHTPTRLRSLGRSALTFAEGHWKGIGGAGLTPALIDGVTGWNNALLDKAGLVTVGVSLVSGIAGAAERWHSGRGSDGATHSEVSIQADEEQEIPPA
jgi:hypothetical protein